MEGMGCLEWTALPAPFPAHDISLPCRPLPADEANTPAQTLLMLFSTAYFVEDTWYCATLPADAFMASDAS